ncbi:helix-turn-helix domain-containing protein [Eubacteriales bacterium OttesenSCG-928-N13]|nr:helix-turn-helix domain-containing protein [Eubacteriales bacterium OttesenSCG-928-N13]
MDLTKDRLVRLRKEKDVNQDVVADLLNVSRSTISNYENGLPVPIDALTALADYYNVSIDYLLCRSHERRPAAGTLPKKFELYAKASGGKSFSASDVDALLNALIKYYRAGAPIGDLPPDILCRFLDGLIASLHAAVAHDTSALLDAVNEATLAGLEVSKLITAYFGHDFDKNSADFE